MSAFRRNVGTLKGHTKAISSVSVSSNGKFMLTGCEDNTAKM